MFVGVDVFLCGSYMGFDDGLHLLSAVCFCLLFSHGSRASDFCAWLAGFDPFWVFVCWLRGFDLPRLFDN